MSIALGHALADLAIGEKLEINPSATGGFDQWCIARMRDARNDYDKLVAGRLDWEAARLRWAKVEAFVASHADKMRAAMPDFFVSDVRGMVSHINHALVMGEDGEEFDPRCDHCRKDMIITGTLHICVGDDTPDDTSTDDDVPDEYFRREDEDEFLWPYDGGLDELDRLYRSQR